MLQIYYIYITFTLNILLFAEKKDKMKKKEKTIIFLKHFKGKSKQRRKKMQTCLGIYIENNLIKYAKVSKDNNSIKIESFGVRFFENLTAEINKIVEETYSFNTPIAINLSEEKYLYFDIFSLLNKNDIQKTVETEFEAYCDEKKYNKNAFEARYALVPKIDDKDKIKAINIFVNKIELNKQMQCVEKYKLTDVLPIGMTIANACKLEKKENVLIVNMEEKTTITTITDMQIYDVETLDIGSGEVLDKINKIENSYSKAYEICKNTTIYTAEVSDSVEEQPYLQYIMPTLYSISQRVQEIVNNSPIKISKVYLTGNLALINNVDLYFQENISSAECRILKPYFLEDSAGQMNIKDYIEVNSSIALAVQRLKDNLKGINFKKTPLVEKLFKPIKMDFSSKDKKNGQKAKTKLNLNINMNLKGKLDTVEKNLIRLIYAIVILTIIFVIFSLMLGKQFDKKEEEIDMLIVKQNAEISKVTQNKQTLDQTRLKYENLLKQLQEINDRISSIAQSRNSIPNLLNQIMFRIPEEVQLISIENTTDKHIVIEAKCKEYTQLGYFIAKLKTSEILTNVISSSGIKNNNEVYVTIEGDLP